MRERIRTLIDKVSFVLLAIILFDCGAFGGGSLVKVFGLDFRMVLYIVFVLVSLPLVILNFKKLFTNKLFLVILLWGIWLIVSTVNGIVKGHRFDLILSALIGFASFVILPGALCVIRNEKRLVALMKTMIFASVALAVQSLLILIAFQTMSGEWFGNLNLFILHGELGGCTIVNEAVIRIFLRSHPLMIVSCVFCVYFSVYKKAKKDWIYSICVALFLFCLMLSYTRSIYFGVLVAVVALAVYFILAAPKEKRTKFFKLAGKSVSILAVMILLCDILCQGLFLSYGVYRTTGIDVAGKVASVFDIPNYGYADSIENPKGDNGESAENTETVETTETEETTDPTKQPNSDIVKVEEANKISLNIRNATQKELVEKILQKPLVGHGIGAMLTVRPAGDNEYFFLDLLFKMGIIGFALYILPILLMIVYVAKAMKQKRIDDVKICVVWLVGLLGIVAFSWFNPYLNGTNGVVIYCITMGAFTVYMDNCKIKVRMRKRKSQ